MIISGNKNKIKIAFVTPLYLPAKLSGSGRIVQGLAEGLTEKGYDCTVVTSNALNTRWWYDPLFGRRIKAKQGEINGVKIVRLGCRQLSSFLALIGTRYGKHILPRGVYDPIKFKHCGPLLYDLCKVLENGKFNFIYSSPFPAYINKQVAEIIPRLPNRTRWILGPYLHAELSDYHNPQLLSLLKTADAVHVASRAEEAQMNAIFQVRLKKYLRIPHFLHTDKLREIAEIQDSVDEFKRKYDLDDKYIVLFAGGRMRLKGAFALLQAMRKLAAKDNKLRLLMIGNSTTEWNKLIKNLRPHFLVDLGWVSEEKKELVFAASNLYCMPSVCESFGLTYLEAWQKKKPVIGADIPPVRELICTARGGVVVKFGETEKLINAIQELRQNPLLASKLGRNGNCSLQKYYTREKVVQQFIEVLTKKI